MARSTGKHVPLRRCVMCRASLPKAELLRLVKGEDGRFELDANARAGGRGTWVCRECASSPTEKRLKQAFRGQASHVRQLLAPFQHDPTPAAGGSAPRARHRDGGTNVR